MARPLPKRLVREEYPRDGDGSDRTADELWVPDAHSGVNGHDIAAVKPLLEQPPKKGMLQAPQESRYGRGNVTETT
jgi:hypothetical protein